MLIRMNRRCSPTNTTATDRAADRELRHDRGRDERDAAGDQLVQRLGAEREPIGEHEPAGTRRDIDDADQRLVRDPLVARSRDREHERADRGERERVQRDRERVVLVVVAHQDRPHHAERRDLREREVDEDHLALDDVHAEVDEDPRHRQGTRAAAGR